MSANFAALFAAQAQARPDAPALRLPGGYREEDGVLQWQTLSFGALHRLSDALAWGLQERVGITRGERVSMLVKPSFEFFVVGMALYKLGAVPVLVDPGMGLRGFLSCVGESRPTALIAVPPGQVLSRVFGRAFASVQRRVVVGGALGLGAHRYADLLLTERGPFPMAPVGPEELGSILFTSGSTGPAKGVHYTHGMFTTQTQRIGELYPLSPGAWEVACFLPFAMFSVSLGSSVLLPDMDFSRPATAEPVKVVRAVQSCGAEQLVGSPAVMARIAAYGLERGLRLPTLRRVLTFGAPIPVGLHRDFRRILAPGAGIHTPYGATEALPVATIDTDTLLGGPAQASLEGAGTCVGAVVPGLELRVIPISDGPVDALGPGLPPGQVGELVVRGPQVTPGYADRPEDNRLARVPDAAGSWHRMGDLGWVDEQGRVWFCGRKSHRVTLADGRVLYPVQVEGVLLAHPAVRRCALVGVKGRAVLVVELLPGAHARHEVRRALLALAAANPRSADVQEVLFYDALPVDRRHNAKIDYPALQAWATRALGGVL